MVVLLVTCDISRLSGRHKNFIVLNPRNRDFDGDRTGEFAPVPEYFDLPRDVSRTSLEIVITSE